ncbi:MAG TPA: hypothetical protein VLF63_02950 [Patescibacteria group bacterium]|nr:hypothetical protein [Patescibacteria group bacterium]
MKHKHYLIKLLFYVPVSLFILTLKPVNATSANLSHSYNSLNPIPVGSVVSLDTTHQGFVNIANMSNSDHLLGICVTPSESLLAVDEKSNSVQVALSGSANTLVSTVNGDIKVGDQISVSPFDGIGEEASPGSHIIGIAETSLTKNTPDVQIEQVKDNNGKTHTISISFIRLTIGIGTGSQNGAGGNQANFLQKLIKSLTGHNVSTIRIILSIVVGLVTLVSIASLVYSSIYGSIVSVGRNPLAKIAIFRTLSSVMVMAFITVAVACVTIYYLLR